MRGFFRFKRAYYLSDSTNVCMSPASLHTMGALLGGQQVTPSLQFSAYALEAMIRLRAIVDKVILMTL
jgi:hypothetical protein